MDDSERIIDLGFTCRSFPIGVHVCQIFSDDDERQEALLKFVLAGLRGGEMTGCFTERLTAEAMEEFLAGYGVSYAEAAQSGALNLDGPRDAYFAGGVFDPDIMLDRLSRFYDEAMTRNAPGARVIGEMLPEVQTLNGGSRLLEYESRVSILLRTKPVTAVCQYDSRLFGGDVIMDVLKVHPYMIVRHTVVNNPFYISPEDYLRGVVTIT